MSECKLFYDQERWSNLNAQYLISKFSNEFSHECLSESLVRSVAMTLLDTYAVALGGQCEPACQAAWRYLGASGLDTQGMSTIWGLRRKTSPEVAALINGVAAHVLDYDDVSSPLRGHPSVVLWPALAALGEYTDLPTDKMVSAYIVGFEVMLKLAQGSAISQYATGWHTTASIGIIGATAACAHLLGLSILQTSHAIGLAVAQTGGIRQNVGTQAKSFQAGHANAAAVRAVLMAQAGFESSPEALDGAFGYFALYAQDRNGGNELLFLGKGALEFERVGIDVKKYPMCYATHRALDAVTDLMTTHKISCDDIESVTVQTNSGALVPLVHPSPEKGLEGKFSMQYGVAAMLLDGQVGLSSFTNDAVGRPSVRALMRRITVRETDSPITPRWAEICIRTKNTAVYTQKSEILRGSAAAPLSENEMLLKVKDCLEWGKCNIDSVKLYDAVMRLGAGHSRQYFQQIYETLS